MKEDRDCSIFRFVSVVPLLERHTKRPVVIARVEWAMEAASIPYSTFMPRARYLFRHGTKGTEKCSLLSPLPAIQTIANQMIQSTGRWLLDKRIDS